MDLLLIVLRRGSQLASMFIKVIDKTYSFWLYWVFARGPGFSQLRKQGHLSGSLRRLLVRWLLLSQVPGSGVLGLQECGSQALEHRMDSCATWAPVAPQHVGSSNSVSSIGSDSSPLSHQGESY